MTFSTGANRPAGWMMVLLELFGIKPHSYPGCDRNYPGPDIRIVFRDIHKLIPVMRDDPAKSPYLSVILALRKLNLGVFGLQLDPNWKELILELKTKFN